MVKFLPVTDWEVLIVIFQEKELKKHKQKNFQNEIDPSIKTWSLNSNLGQGSSPELKAWHERNIWFGVDYDMTESALNYHQSILNSDLIGFSEESPDYLVMIDAYMKSNFFDFFYTREFAYWIRKEDPEEPYHEKDTLFFKRQGKFEVVTSEHYQLSVGGSIEALRKWQEVRNKIQLIRYRPIENSIEIPPLKNLVQKTRH